MSDDLLIRFEQIEGAFEDPVEAATFARLWLQVGDRFLSRSVNRKTGARDYLKLPLYNLATGIAENWWTLLYEPWRPEEATPKRMARHHLDAFVTGFVFPSFGIWSAGEEAITIETGRIHRFSRAPAREMLPSEREVAARVSRAPAVSQRSLSQIELVDESRERVTVSRQQLESQLFELVDTVLGWIESDGQSDPQLAERWAGVVRSLEDPEEHNYCTAAGRLGFDPYDPETPDISVFAAELPEDSFDDLCEAARFDELARASAWVSREQSTLDRAPVIDVSDFGKRPTIDPRIPSYEAGYRDAIALRSKLLLDDDPRRATRRLLGTAEVGQIDDAPPVVEGLLARGDTEIHARVAARSTAQWRFRECRAAYLGWNASPGDYPLLTTASTYRQQASRSFAAELLCPADYLRHKVGNGALTSDQLNDIAGALDCQPIIVEHQARNHNIPLRGFY
ncbi:hypothetical protein ACFSGX_12525 [Sphingomonas arantia]|uniref:Uncharacterized protein n=1 Tax=Sphingomonas arantia TaxID=1460676 RepID=A0ABW4U010_9SPHN